MRICKGDRRMTLRRLEKDVRWTRDGVVADSRGRQNRLAIRDGVGRRRPSAPDVAMDLRFGCRRRRSQFWVLQFLVANKKEVQISLTGFMEKNTVKFMKELWTLLISAQNNPSGVSDRFLDAKQEEARKKKDEALKKIKRG